MFSKQELNNRTQLVNKCHRINNELMPKLVDFFEKEEPQIKVDGSMFKKHKQKLDVLLEPFKEVKNIQWVSVDIRSGLACLSVRGVYSTGRNTAQSYESFTHFYEMHTGKFLENIDMVKPLFEEDELYNNIVKAKELKEKVNKLEREMRDALTYTGQSERYI